MSMWSRFKNVFRGDGVSRLSYDLGGLTGQGFHAHFDVFSWRMTHKELFKNCSRCDSQDY